MKTKVRQYNKDYLKFGFIVARGSEHFPRPLCGMFEMFIK